MLVQAKSLSLNFQQLAADAEAAQQLELDLGHQLKGLKAQAAQEAESAAHEVSPWQWHSCVALQHIPCHSYISPTHDLTVLPHRKSTVIKRALEAACTHEPVMLTLLCRVQLIAARAEQHRLREELSVSFHKAAASRAGSSAAAAAAAGSAGVQERIACAGLSQQCVALDEQLLTHRAAHQVGLTTVVHVLRLHCCC